MDEHLQEIVERFIRVRRHTKDGVRKMHKPLLQLLALSAFAKTGSSRIEYDSTKPIFAALLREYGPPASRHTLAYPFRHMVNDGIWIARLADGAAVTCATPVGQLKGAVGHFSHEVEAALRVDSKRASSIAWAVANTTLQQELASQLLWSLKIKPIQY